MTHSLHRQGDRASLEKDYVIFITPTIGVNEEGSGEKLASILEILLEEGVTNIGDVEHGSVLGGLDPGDLRAHMGDGKRIRACVSDRGALRRILERLRDADLGLSVTVSGLIDEVFDVSREIGAEPHTINLALGVWGRTELLPEPRVLEVTTMCGHYMISEGLVGDAMERVRPGPHPKRRPRRRSVGSASAGSSTRIGAGRSSRNSRSDAGLPGKRKDS